MVSLLCTDRPSVWFGTAVHPAGGDKAGQGVFLVGQSTALKKICPNPDGMPEISLYILQPAVLLVAARLVGVNNDSGRGIARDCGEVLRTRGGWRS